MKTVTISWALILFASVAQAQNFQRQAVSFTPDLEINSKIEWIDIDGDSDLDMFSFYIDPNNSSSGYVRLYVNNNRIFQAVDNPFGTQSPVPTTYAFGDYDHDNDIDILLVDNFKVEIIVNNGGLSFTIQDTGIRTNWRTIVAHWVDVDGDGDLDILIPLDGTAYDILINNRGTYVQSLNSISPPIETMSLADLNNDGLIDIVALSNAGGGPGYVSLNIGDGIFKAQSQPFSPNINDKVKTLWDDVDSDGDIDLFIEENGNQWNLYKNSFVETGTAQLSKAFQFQSASPPSGDVGDVNSDGLPDFIMTGQGKSLLYVNHSTKTSILFTETNLGITTGESSNVSLLDIDHVSGLDFFFMAQAVSSNIFRTTDFYINSLTSPAQPPVAPINLRNEFGDQTEFFWDPVATNGSVKYNLEVKRGSEFFISSLSLTDGTQKRIKSESILLDSKIGIRDLPAGDYAWRVQTIDASKRASPFSVPQQFTIAPAPTDLVATPSDKLTELTLSWACSTPVTSFSIFKMSASGSEKIAELPGNTFSYRVGPLMANKHYKFVVRAMTDGIPSAPSDPLDWYTAQFVSRPFPNPPNILAYVSTTADFNNDSVLDILTTDQLSGFSCLLNDGTGSYSVQRFGLSATDFKIRDMDNDGDEDVCIDTGGRISIYSNDNGVLSKTFDSPGYSNIPQLEVADFNEDGLPDILYHHFAGNPEIHGYTILYQKNITQFEVTNVPFVPNNSANNYDFSNSFVIGDFNNDSFIDVIVLGVGNGGAAKVFRGLPGPGFDLVSDNLSVASLATFDFNQDGNLDFLSLGTSGLKVFTGNGNFQFQQSAIIEIPFLGFGTSHSIQVADLDLNGYPDLLLSDGKASGILQGYQNGVYVPAEIPFPLIDPTFPLLVTDMENDGDLDIIQFGADQWDAINFVYENLIISQTSFVNNAYPTTPTGITVGDLGAGKVISWQPSGDDQTPTTLLTYNLQLTDALGKQILNAETNTAGDFRRRLGSGNVGKENHYEFNELPPGQYSVKVQALDASFKLSAFSNDASFTILSGPQNLSIGRIFLNKIRLSWTEFTGASNIIVERRSEDSGFQMIAELAANAITYEDAGLEYNKNYTYRIYAIINNTSTANSNSVSWDTGIFKDQLTDLPNIGGIIEVRDFDNNGTMDILMSGTRISNGFSYDRTSALFENSAGGFIRHEVGTPETTNNFQLNSFDINEDGLLDLIQLRYQADFTAVTETFLNNGNNLFSPVNSWLTSNTINYLWDFDFDNDLDAVTYGSRYFRNDGGGNFTTSTADLSFPKVYSGDFDRDGNEDIIWYSYTNNCYVLYQNVNGKLTATTTTLASLVGEVKIIDFNGDGWLDVSIQTPDHGALFRNLGLDTSGKLQFSKIKNDLPVGPTSWADFDHDGDLDLLMLSTGHSIFINSGNDVFTRNQYIELNTNAANWIDIDNDGDLDILLPGYNGENQSKALALVNQLIVNNEGIRNDPPVQPTNLLADQDEDGLHLTWDAPSDDHSAKNSLTYDIIISRNGRKITRGNLNPTTGLRLKLVNGSSASRLWLKELEVGTYSWQVQAIDQSFASSALSVEGQFFFKPVAPIINDTLVYRCKRVINLTAIGQNLEWFSDAGLTAKIANGSVYHPETSQTVYVTQTINGIRGVPNKVNIVIHERPDPPTVDQNPFVYCYNGGEISLSANGQNINWYADKAESIFLGKGNSVDVFPPPVDAFAYVTQTVQGCESDVTILEVRPSIDTRLYLHADTLFVFESSATKYEWFKDNSSIPNSNRRFIKLLSAGKYYVKMQKTFCNGTSAVTEIIGQSTVTGWAEIDNVDSLLVFPNPAVGELYVRTPVSSDGKIIIFNSLSQVVFERGHDSASQLVTISVAEWNRGIYFVQFIDQKRKYFKKIILH